MDHEAIAEDIINVLELNFGNFGERALAKSLVEDILIENSEDQVYDDFFSDYSDFGGEA